MSDSAPAAVATAAPSPFERARSLPAADLLLLASFFVSGASALAYQVAWQRALYAQIGVDMDSITIIVSVFMLGIGVGGMAGGWLADRWPGRRLQLYALMECTIGAFGLGSLKLLPVLVGALDHPGSGAGATALACFFFLALPTVMMGMTLPLLTIAFDERRGNIGMTVGTLYFTNTIGAALGAALVPLWLLPRWPLSAVVVLAAAGNFFVLACTLLAVFATRRRA
jgi:MFS family permease